MVEIKKISENIYEIPKKGKMLVPTLIYASDKLIKAIKLDKTLQQAQNVAMLDGIVEHALVMPDAHQGYGFPIGGVAAFDLKKGVVSPGGVGYDINCGVRLLASNLTTRDIKGVKKELLHQISRDVPSGLGRGGAMKLNEAELKQIIEKGCKWAVAKGYGNKEDLERIEDNGCIPGAKFEYISEKARRRGFPQLGSLGSGNHFLDILEIEEIFDKNIAKKFGINQKGQITVMIHCGSRGLGHQVASDYIRMMEDEYGIKNLPDRELINAPINSKLGKQYLSAMAGAANFGFANRHLIMHFIRDSFKQVIKKSKLKMVYDVAHNVAKIEDHLVNGKKIKLCVHRKGATRSFGPGRKELPNIYKNIGQPVIIPGSMGTSSYVLVGTEKAEEISFGSTAHGAGRVMSRHGALKKFRGEKIKEELNKKGIEIKSQSWKSLTEENPEVYKDIEEVVKVSHELGIGNLVAKMKPSAVLIG